ncbi:VCBS repeat domain-containing M23 family metallopeptidase [Arthrobacter caoxuetaonis]|uniref:VCBS repeat domain-containing M23 family metallopeptidase n=1 Tax=Arthrobacter caoxuetaonis TaxID=2886935 RepID=A0A9X1SF77_9MICC|nr:VCBS repeat domain-containing M23 family metallopeptidase [Arthrobacter caoxuetaonis]MCC3298304.1 VCBS repeat domain-containing M23 family metallopeptidase [Arthrobacter caoxuetaonis]USQ57679.1 VCBS repeat domain-containing M23 family metallopeptidase [Arthrobacter caoxuetaonis]
MFKKIMGATIAAVVIASTGLVGGLPAAQAAPGAPFKLPYPAGFGYQITQSPSSSFSHNDNYNRHAVDIGMPTGATVVASAAGTVYSSGWDGGGGGYMVLINHGNDRCSQYAHLKTNPLVGYGQSVAQGQHIGYSGSTGNSTAPHLHWNIVNCGNKLSREIPNTVEMGTNYPRGVTAVSQNGLSNGLPGADGERVSDFSGDGQSDVLGVDGNGDFWYYPHSGSGLSARSKIGSGWANHKHVVSADWSGDGAADVIAVDPGGDLYYYPNNNYQLSSATKIGNGWANYKHVMAADWSGDGQADVIGVDAQGDLWYYAHNGTGLSAKVKIGSGWANYKQVMAADWSGDGQADILGVDAQGDLWYYAHNGTGLSAKVKIGSGWANHKQVIASDWSGDGQADILGVDAQGDLWYYAHNGTGLSAKVKIGSDWSTFLHIM